MTTFFDKKQDVMSVELTPYGKYLLSAGKFKPTFYSFHDDEVMYDVAYASSTEEQNNAVTRIKENPLLKPVYNFSGSLSFPASYGKEESHIAINDTNYSLTRPLGTSDMTKDKQPSWDIKVQPGGNRISGSVVYSAPHQRSQEIPQIEMRLNTEYMREDNILSLIKEELTHLQIRERNVVWDRFDNYDVEVFMLSDDGNITRQLSFVNDENPQALEEIAASIRKAHAVGDFLSATEEEIENEFNALDDTYVEYYLDLRVDREIEDFDVDPQGRPEIDEFAGLLDREEALGEDEETIDKVCD